MRLIGDYSFIFNKKITCAVIAVFSILLLFTDDNLDGFMAGRG